MSRTLVSVIVTTKNSARTLQRCLQSIRAQTYQPLEVLAVDNGSADDTPRIARILADQVLDAGPERCVQRNAGIRASRGDYVFVIDSDMILGENVIERAVAYIKDGCEAVAIPEESFGEGFWSKCKTAERRCYLDDGSTVAARFFTRRLLDEVGWYDESIIGGEDWDLSIRACKGKDPVLIDALILHDEGRPSLIGLFRKRLYYGHGVRLFLKKHRGAAIRRIQPFRLSLIRNAATLFKNPIVGCGCVVMKSVELLATYTGMLLPASYRAEDIYLQKRIAGASTDTPEKV